MTGSLRLDVYVARQRVGALAAERPDRYVFTYDNAAPVDRFVSLTMPVRLESYVWHELHPIFQMSLPEGDLLARLSSRLAKIGAGRPIDLLAFTGAELIGRVNVYPEGSAPEAPLDTHDFADLMTAPDTRRLFVDLVEAHLARGVSGVMPKAISMSKEKAGDRLTAFDAGGIYKTGNDDFPDLALNEWFCLRVAQRAGIEVPTFELSQDRRVLRLVRFDRTPAGPLGFEDFAVLQGLGTAQKYESTYERVVKSAATFVPAGERVGTRREMFRRIVLCWMLRNGDAHLKNFGLLYSSAADARLGPLYDVVTTTAYPMLRQRRTGPHAGWTPLVGLEEGDLDPVCPGALRPRTGRRRGDRRRVGPRGRCGIGRGRAVCDPQPGGLGADRRDARAMAGRGRRRA